MIENQQNKNLQQIRSEIDLIDNQIIELLKQRMSLIPLVSKIKKDNHEKFFIKSNQTSSLILLLKVM
jgi:chorismate mutase